MNVWTVTCDYVKGVLTYFVENTITGERRGTFDCEAWAKEMARELNREGGQVNGRLRGLLLRVRCLWR